MRFKNITRGQLKYLLELEKQYTESDESLLDIKRRFDKYPFLFIGCFKGGELIGEISGYMRDEKVIIKSIVVKDEYQQRGIGQKLVEAFEKQAKKYSNVVSVASTGDDVDTFYQRCGYKPTQILLQIHKKDLPSDYKNREYPLINEREEGDSKMLYIKQGKYKPKLRDRLKREYQAYEANFIFEKKL